MFRPKFSTLVFFATKKAAEANVFITRLSATMKSSSTNAFYAATPPRKPSLIHAPKHGQYKMKKKYKSRFYFKNLQFKSLESLQLFCHALTTMEETNGIHECKITMKGCFFCPWIDLDKLNKTDMELLIRELIADIKEQENETPK